MSSITYLRDRKKLHHIRQCSDSILTQLKEACHFTKQQGFGIVITVAALNTMCNKIEIFTLFTAVNVIMHFAFSQIMDHGPLLSWDDIAGLEFAKNVIKEIVVWPMLRP